MENGSGTYQIGEVVTAADSTAATAFPIVFHNESNGLLDDTGAFTYKPSEGDVEVPGSIKCTKNLRRTVTAVTLSTNTATCTLTANDNFSFTLNNAANTINIVA